MSMSTPLVSPPKLKGNTAPFDTKAANASAGATTPTSPKMAASSKQTGAKKA
jgi:hypothetical protein